MKDIIKNKQYLIKNNYLSSKTNHVICMDITDLEENGEIYVGIDIAARVVIMHCYKKEPLNVKDIIETLTMAIKGRGFLPNIKIIHSDRGTIFKNLPFQQFIEEQGIDISRGSVKGHTNQVMERTFRSLKDLIRDQMDSSWRKRRKVDIQENKKSEKKAYDPIKTINLDYQKMRETVENAYNTYNNRPHGAIGKMTPFAMEKALYEHYEGKKEALNSVPLLTKNEQSKQAEDIRKVQTDAIIRFVAKTRVLPKAEMQTRLYNYLQNWFERVIDTVEDQKENTNKQIEKLKRRNQDLYELNLQLQQSLHNIELESEIQRVGREDAEEKRNKRKNAVKAPIRETIEKDEFFFILDLVKHSNFVGGRKKAR